MDESLTEEFTITLEFLGLMDGQEYGDGPVPGMLRPEGFPADGIEVIVQSGDRKAAVRGVIEKVLDVTPAEATVLLRTEKDERIRIDAMVYVDDKNHDIEARGILHGRA
ncbi:TPA: hypothetical protein EYP38_04705 [Candidatus Micrarchaeota archaeon]|nr:hypothetical protein [Candidatus Micrarchaeota archaeon]